MRAKNDILILLENGLSFNTISTLNDNQIKILSEKFSKKKENKEAVTKTVYQPTKNPKDMEAVQAMVSKVDPNASVELDERFESKSQQALFWSKCDNSKGKTKEKWCKMAKEFSDSTSKKQYKNMPEKKHPEKTVKRTSKKTNENLERFLEDRILDILDEHINPTFTKGNMLKTISEKSNKFNSMILKNPKKMSMFSDESGIEMKKMDKPIGKMFSMGGSLGEDTKEKERTKEREKTKTPTRRKGNPFKDPVPDVEEKPKAHTREKERTKEREKTKTPTRRKENPFKDPNPGVEEQPKAKMEKQQSNFIDAIMNVLNY